MGNVETTSAQVLNADLKLVESGSQYRLCSDRLRSANDECGLHSGIDASPSTTTDTLEDMAHYYLNKAWDYYDTTAWSQLVEMPEYIRFRTRWTGDFSWPSVLINVGEDPHISFRHSNENKFFPTASDAYVLVNSFFRFIHYSATNNSKAEIEGVDYAIANYFAYRCLKGTNADDGDSFIFERGGNVHLGGNGFYFRPISMELDDINLFGNNTLWEYYNSDWFDFGQPSSELLSATLWSIANQIGLLKMDNLIILSTPELDESIESQAEAAAKIFEIAFLNDYTIDELCILFDTFSSIYRHHFTSELDLNLYAECVGYRRIPIFSYFDINQNGSQDDGEYLINDIAININDSVDYVTSITPHSFITKQEGVMNVAYNETANPDWQLTSSTSNFEVLLDENYISDTLYFGVAPTDPKVEVSLSLSSDLLRCNEPSQIHMSIKNTGNIPLTDLDYQLVLDEILELDMIDRSIPNLRPGDVHRRSEDIDVPGPDVFTIGENLDFQLVVDYTHATEEYSKTKIFSDLVLCSYDPNDKLVNPNREDNAIYEGEGLDYVIRFQNTGNAPAYVVEVLDTIESKLSLSTLRVLDSSHPDILTTTIDSDKRIVSFLFSDIFLPDSLSNPEGSQGYISFSIQPEDDFAFGEEINNSASIYFDFNPPILTNTTRSILTMPLNTSGVVDNVNIYPNPTTQTLYFDEVIDGSYEIIDIQGRVLDSNLIEGSQIDISRLLPSIYFVKIKERNKPISTHRFVKM